jgi:hypothetical protein
VKLFQEVSPSESCRDMHSIYMSCPSHPPVCRWPVQITKFRVQGLSSFCMRTHGQTGKYIFVISVSNAPKTRLNLTGSDFFRISIHCPLHSYLLSPPSKTRRRRRRKIRKGRGTCCGIWTVSAGSAPTSIERKQSWKRYTMLTSAFHQMPPSQG